VATAYTFYVVAATLFLALHHIDAARYSLKAVPVLLLAVLALGFAVQNRIIILHCNGRLAATRPFLVCGVLCLYGIADLILELDHLVYELVYVGILLFAVGHVLMVIVISTTGHPTRVLHPTGAVTSVPYIIIGWAAVVLLFVMMGDQILTALGLFVYLFILLVVTWRAVARIYAAVHESRSLTSVHLFARPSRSRQEIAVAVGYHLFIVSDMILVAHEYKGAIKSDIVAAVLIMVTYWTSIALISTEMFSVSMQKTWDNTGPTN